MILNNYGYSVGFHKNTAIIGAPGSINGGAAYIYGIPDINSRSYDIYSNSIDETTTTISIAATFDAEKRASITLYTNVDIGEWKSQTYFTSECSNLFINNDYTVNIQLDVVNTICIEVVFDDCQNIDDVVNHGPYTISTNNNIGVYGGYYGLSESNIVCTDNNHASYCIVLNYCNNKTQLWQLDGYSIDSLSYNSMVNSSLLSSTANMDGSIVNTDVKSINCLGVESCCNIYCNINLELIMKQVI